MFIKSLPSAALSYDTLPYLELHGNGNQALTVNIELTMQFSDARCDTMLESQTYPMTSIPIDRYGVYFIYAAIHIQCPNGTGQNFTYLVRVYSNKKGLLCAQSLGPHGAGDTYPQATWLGELEVGDAIRVVAFTNHNTSTNKIANVNSGDIRCGMVYLGIPKVTII